MKPNRGTGDDGTTSLAGGSRRRKDDPRVEAYGTVDELAAQVGAAIAARGPIAELVAVLDDLHALAASLAAPGAAGAGVGVEAVNRLDRWTAEIEGGLPPLRSLIRPIGCAEAAAFHVARTVCRRAERRVVELAGSEPIDPDALRYLNRLSDLLFALARLANHRAGIPDDPAR